MTDDDSATLGGTAESNTSPPAPSPPEPRDDLSEREVDVLRLIALGHTNAEIAEQLYLSVRTVETHRAHIQQKLGLSTRSQLVGYALERGLLKTGGERGG
jgi:two-component system response regulator NreC